jgi:V/A-type H+/Na+-transporting ATPase subunit I
MILPMCRVRLLGPRELRDRVLSDLQDFGRVQLDEIFTREGLAAVRLSARENRERRQLARIVEDVELAMKLLDISDVAGSLLSGESAPTPPPFASWARFANRARRFAEALDARRTELDDERVLLERYRDFFDAFRGLLAGLAGSTHLSVYGVTLPAAERSRVDAISHALSRELGAGVVVTARPLPSGDLAVLVTVPEEIHSEVEQALAGARIHEVPLPKAYASKNLADAAPLMLARLDEIPKELASLGDQRRARAEKDAALLRTIRRAARDRLRMLDALTRSSLTRHAFVVEGWVPEDAVRPLAERVRRVFEGVVTIEELAREEWKSAPAPVVLKNPRIFKPFETVVRLMPLPRYGSIDPTPFVAVTFPLFFGIILGDVGYGLLLGALALWLRSRTRPASKLRDVAEMAIPCAAFSVIFGALYGEMFGNLGVRVMGMRPLLIDREHAVVAAMLGAVGLGLAHTVLGLVLGIVTAVHHGPRAVISRTVQLLMLAFVVLALLAAVHVLPAQLFTPFGVAVLAGLPVLVLAEGIIAPIEFFSTLGRVLSYVRIMAIGTASVMLAVVANELAGSIGSAVVGVLFALLFHVVNFAIGLLSPTLHSLRLHYVEFFQQFYSPGGQPYEPFTHWRPAMEQRSTV